MNMRIKKLSMKEFNALERNADGDLLNMFDNFLLFTDKQVDLLSEDDYSRYLDYREELDYEMNMLREEFAL
jgi:hypothetical protein